MRKVKYWDISRKDKTKRCGQCLYAVKKDQKAIKRNENVFRFPYIHLGCLKKLNKRVVI